MNKKILTLAAALLTVSAASAQTYQDKTFLNPQVVGSVISDNVTKWPAQCANKHKSGKTKLGVTLFTEQSTNKSDLGKYFGVNGKDNFKVGSVDDTTIDVDGGYLVHDKDTAPNSTLGGIVTLKPQRVTYGMNLDLQRDLDLGIKGMFVRVGIPVVNVEHKLGYTITNATGVTITDSSPAAYSQTVSLEDFFTGNAQITNRGDDSALNQQNPLTKNRFKNSQSKNGFGDITLALGKTLVDHQDKRCVMYLEGILPTSNSPKAHYLFEPQRGNNGHVGLALGLDAQAQAWHKNDMAIHVAGHGKFTYLFEGSETRVLGTKNLAVTAGAYTHNNNFGHYSLTDIIIATTVPGEPAANHLAESLRVRPGSKLEAGLQGRFVYKAFSAGLGYNLTLRDNESVWRKSNVDEKVGIINKEADIDSGPLNGYFPLAAGNLSTDAAKTPVQLGHTVSGELTFKPSFKACSNMALALGGSYQLLADNSGVEQFGLWLSAGWIF